MKKLFSFLFVMVLGFAMVACNKKDGGDEGSEITINFETNGGSAITSTTIDTKNVGTFVLPQNPTKEGYVFAGWYVDSALTKAFDALNAEDKSITLYAKWEDEGKGLNANLSFTFAVKLDVAAFEGETEDELEEEEETKETHVDFNGNLKLTFSLENKEIEELNDLKLALGVTLTLENNSDQSFSDEADAIIGQITAAPVEASLYVNNGFLYLTYGLVSYKVDLNEVVNFVKDEFDAFYERFGEEYLADGSELPTDPEQILPFVLEQVNYYADLYDVDLTLVLELLSQLMVFIPEARTADGKTTFAITQADFNSDIDAVVSYVKSNEERIIGQIYDTVQSFFNNMFNPVYEEYVDDETGAVFSKAKAGYTDAEGTFHSFAEDLEEEDYGEYYADINVYYSDMLNCYFKIAGDDWTAITKDEYKALLIGTTCTDYNGNVFTYGTPSYKKADGTVVSLLENFEQLENDSIGYYDEDDNTFYVYTTGERYDIATGKLFDERAASIKAGSENLDAALDTIPALIKAAVKINEIKLVLGDKACNFNFNVEFDANPLKDLMDENIQAKINLAINASYANAKVTITYPDFSQAVDVTGDILSGATPKVE